VLQTLISAISLPTLPADSQEPALTHLVTSMMNTQLLPNIMKSLESAYSYHQDPRPNRKPPDVIGSKETNLFCLLSHIAIRSPTTFLAVLHENAQWLIAEWISHFDAIGSIQDKKLQTIAITNLFSGRPPAFILEQLQSFMTIWTDICIALGDEA